MRTFRLLAVSAVLLTGVVGVLAVSETQVFATDPQAQVNLYDGLWASVQGDSYTASSTTLWERNFQLQYNVQSGTVTGPSAQITLPNGLSDVRSWSPGLSHINWTGATNTLTGTWLGVPADGATMEAGAIQPYSMGAPPVSISRSISDPVLTDNNQTRTVTLDVTVNSPLAAGTWFNANLVNSWDMPQGMAYTVGTPTLPTGFFAGPDPGSYYCPNPSALVVNNTYHFEAAVQFNRSGELAQGTAGDLYYKPQSGVNYGVSGSVQTASGTSIAITTPSGVAATFSSLTPTDFTGNTHVNNGLALGGVVAGVGAAMPSHISVSRLKETSISGTTLHSVSVEVMGANIIEGTITSPGPGFVVYDLQPDTDDKSWWLEFGSTTESDLDGFTAGTYNLALKGSDGVTRNFTILGPEKDVPTGMPTFTQAMGFDTTDKRPTIGWLASTDQNVTKNYMEISSDKDGAYEFSEMLEKNVLSHTPTEDLDPGAWYVMVAYSNHTDTFTGGDAAVPLEIDFATVTDAYFNVTPEPATLALLAAGACALRMLRRRR
jgi:hypothetical protein